MTQRDVQVELSPSGRTFVTTPGRTILESGLSAGVALPFGCANGSCGSCRVKVLKGTTEKVRFHDYTLSAAEKIAGVQLMCSTVASDDLVIEVQEALSVADIPHQELAARLCRLDVRDGVTVAAFKFSRGNALRFFSGQWVDLKFEDGLTERLPVASCPCNAQYVEFHLPLRDSEAAKRLGRASSRERVTVSGPHGSFTLSADLPKPKIFIAVGEGFASVQGLVEHIINLELESRCVVIWQSTENVGHYFDNLCRSWVDVFDQIEYRSSTTSEELGLAIDELGEDLTSTAEFYVSVPEGHGPDRVSQHVREKFDDAVVYINSA